MTRESRIAKAGGRFAKSLVASADGLATLLGLRVLHLAVSVETVEELAAGRLPAHLERAAHRRDANLAIPTVLRMAVLPAT